MKIPSASSVRAALLIMAVVIVAHTVGCGKSPNPHGYIGIAGTVRFDGKPMADGSVTFLPVSNAKLIAGSPVTAGRFSIPPAKGLPPGEYRVFFAVFEETDQAVNSGDPAAANLKVRQNVVAADWAQDTTTQTITIPAGKSVARFDFDVPRKIADAAQSTPSVPSP
jgi:hypothetical protein